MPTIVLQFGSYSTNGTATVVNFNSNISLIFFSAENPTSIVRLIPNNNTRRDGEVPSQKELSSYFEELFSCKVSRQKKLSSSNEELFTNPEHPNL